MPKVPAKWSNSLNKKPANWSGSRKTPQAWSGRTKAPAGAWTNAVNKHASAWAAGQYIYDTFLSYDNPIGYDGAPTPISQKIPTNWSAA